ncbi:hypothetical protein Bxe_A2344 [Paraburkholderia xenovorans LB400]|uniref:Uncharacterized protein n=1 Tax=Paraburkholderia xenovorans (strain LB400) TaxID=266265 RepID=Q13Z63_PARXL|nr:hypothetical protein Bxe_A2344 [Paraburkholderia xenovorans LB400]
MRACYVRALPPLVTGMRMRVCWEAPRVFCCTAGIPADGVNLPHKRFAYERISAHKPMQYGSFFRSRPSSMTHVQKGRSATQGKR